MNLKKETLRELQKHGKKESDILRIICDNKKIDIKDFFRLANIEYEESGYKDDVDVNRTLRIVGDGWALCRVPDWCCDEDWVDEGWKFVSITDDAEETMNIEEAKRAVFSDYDYLERKTRERKIQQLEARRKDEWCSTLYSLLKGGASFEAIKETYKDLPQSRKPRYDYMVRETITVEVPGLSPINFECFGIDIAPDFTDLITQHKSLGGYRGKEAYFDFPRDEGTFVRIIEKHYGKCVAVVYKGKPYSCDVSGNLLFNANALHNILNEVIKNEQAEKSVDGNDGQ